MPGPYTTIPVAEFNRLSATEQALLEAMLIMDKAREDVCQTYCLQDHVPTCIAIRAFLARQSLGLKPGAARDV